MSCDDAAELEHQTKTEVTYILLSLYLHVSTLKLQMQSSSYGDGLMDPGLGLGLGTQLEVRECDVCMVEEHYCLFMITPGLWMKGLVIIVDTKSFG